MPNPDFAEDKKGMGGRAMKPRPTGVRGGKSDMKMKPAFPSMGAAGKTQPKNRSGGVKKAKVYPHSDGL